MYVIYPAEEIINLSYGIPARRVLPRPTLDNLQEPRVGNPSPTPIDHRYLFPPTTIDTDEYNRDGYDDFTSSRPDVSVYSSTTRLSPLPTKPPVAVSPTTKAPATTKKSKLQLKLAKLGRPHSNPVNETNESARVNEYHDIVVSNPTFTRDNLRQRNYDAFFESGEPVYQIETKEKCLPPVEIENTFMPPPPPPPPKSKLNFLKRRKDKTLSLDMVEAGNRSRRGSHASGDILLLLEDPQKEPKSPNRFSIFGARDNTSRNALASPTSSKSMATTSGGGPLHGCSHPDLNETLKKHNAITFKLAKTVQDFTEGLSQIYGRHGEELKAYASSFGKRHVELRKERPACTSTLFNVWEIFLQEIEADSQSSSEVAKILSKQVSRLDRTLPQKQTSRQVFVQRDALENVIGKCDEHLQQCRMDYRKCYSTHRHSPSQATFKQYLEAHNAYVIQLHAENAMLHTYHYDTLPQLMQELEEAYNDLSNVVAETVLQSAETISSKSNDQSRRFDTLVSHCKSVNPTQDLTNFARCLSPPPNAQPMPKLKVFIPAPPPGENDGEYGENLVLRDEIVAEKNGLATLRPTLDSLKQEAANLEAQIRQIQDSIDTNLRSQGQLYNRDDLLESISMKKYDIRTKQLQLASVQAKKELFVRKLEPNSPTGGSGERKLSTSSASSMTKSRWVNTFFRMKSASGGQDKKNGSATNAQLQRMGDVTTDNHNLQEYTYKKITPCDVCSQVLRGHTKQGLRCRICKTNVHVECMSQLTKCQVKAKLLRRQKSTSEIENNRIELDEEKEGPLLISRKLSTRGSNAHYNSLEPNDVDQTYQVLKQAGEISGGTKVNEKTNDQITTITTIPVVNVPDYPERQIPRRGPLKPGPATTKQPGLAAPAQDISSSDYRVPGIPPVAPVDTGTRRRLFAGFRPLSGFGRLRIKSTQHRSISLPETPHSPRRAKLNLRMKSLSLDSPDATELHGNIRGRRGYAGPGPSGHHGGSGGALENTPPSNNSRLHSPSSPPQTQRRLLYANRALKSGSADLPDEIEKSLSSASTSPCPSPIRQHQKMHRLLPTNLYIVLYNFIARHSDELDLKPGYKVTVSDTSDPDWWKGKCFGRVGYFPSKYVVKLAAGERVLQVTQNIGVVDAIQGGTVTLLRDQIVIQTGDEVNGYLKVRTADNRLVLCQSKHLQEV